MRINEDYLYLILVGIFGLILLSISSKNKSEEPFEIRFQFFAVYIMIFLGFIGLLLLIIDLF